MASGTWIATTASTPWATASNWTGNVVADGAGNLATFYVNLAAAQTIDATASGGWSGTIGNIKAGDNTSGWFGQSFNNGTITLDNGASTPTIEIWGTAGAAASIGAVVINSQLAGTSGFDAYPIPTAGTNAAYYLIVQSASTGLSGPVEIIGNAAGTRSIRLQLAPGALTNIDGVTLNGGAGFAALDLINGSAGGTNTFSKPVTSIGTTTNTFIEVMGTDVVLSGDNSGFTNDLRLFIRNTGSVATISPTSASWYSTAPVLSFTAANNLGSTSGWIDFYAEVANTAGWGLKYIGTAATTVNRNIDIRPTGGSSGATSAALAAQLYADGTGTVEYAGTIISTGGTGYLTLRGTSTGNNEIAGVIQAPGSSPIFLTKTDAGKWILSAANLFTTGSPVVNAGILNLQHANALGGSSNTGVLTISGTGTLELEGGISVTRSGQSSAVSISGTGQGGIGALRSAGSSGANTFIPPSTGIALGTTIAVGADAGTSLDITAAGAITGTAFGINKVGAGTVRLSGLANTYTGPTSVVAGVLEVTRLANAGSNSSIGAPAAGANAVIPLTGTLRYVGTTADSTNRSITFTSTAPSIENTGSAAITFSAATQAAGSRTITFGGSNTGNNTFSAALGDGSGGSTSVAKTGVGKWILSGAPTFTGTLSVSEGTLDLNAVVFTLSAGLQVSGGTLQNATLTLANTGNTLSGSSVITAGIGGSGKTVTVTGGTPQLAPSTGSNPLTGGTLNITGGTLELTTESESGGQPAQVVGSMAVNVSAGAGIRTTTGTIQRGRMRFGGPVTFNGTSGNPCKFYIGS